MTPIALVTAREVGDLDEDLQPLIAALRGAGLQADAAVWDDPAVNWGSYRLAVLRSTWDYARRRDEFLTWADRTERVVPLANSAATVRWNTDKHYLRDLAAAGIPVVPTHFIEPADPVRFPFAGEFVVKPAVGAGSLDAARHEGDTAAARDHVKRLQAAGRSVLVQPYLRNIDQAGETALVFLGGRYSHAIRKGPMLGAPKEVQGGLFLKEDIRAREASADERALAERVLTAAARPLLYARVDLIPGPDGLPVLLELETTEPSLFFAFAPGSADRFARAIAAWKPGNDNYTIGREMAPPAGRPYSSTEDLRS